MLISEGYDVEIFYLHEDERSEIVKSILTSKGIAIGDPTINDEPYPKIGGHHVLLKGLRFDKTNINRKAVTFEWVEKGGTAKKTPEKNLKITDLT